MSFQIDIPQPSFVQPAAAGPQLAGLQPPDPELIAHGPLEAPWKARRMARETGLDLHLVAGTGLRGRVSARNVIKATAAPAAPVAATPVAANLAAALGLDLSQVSASGPGGRISQADVLRAAADIIRTRASAGGASPTSAEDRPSVRHPPRVSAAIPLQGVRRIVSAGMTHSAHTAARVSLMREVNASELVSLRRRFQASGVTASFADLLIRICAVALRKHPAANARLGEGQVELLDRVNVGLAVDTDRGLLVPVVHDADRATIPQIAPETARLVDAARTGRIQPDDLAGGTSTIANLGMIGVDGFTPIIRLPESSILGVGRIVRKPVACGDCDTVVVRATMCISLAFDHRVLDGAPAARFLDGIARLIEDPTLLLTV